MYTWNKTISATKPLEVDLNSSPYVVWVRKNIEQTTIKDEDDNVITVWQYDEMKIPQEEYDKWLSSLEAIKVEERVDKLTTANEENVISISMLEDCVLEMSEIIYGGE